MYRHGELGDEWSETMEVEIMEEGKVEEFDIHSLMAYQWGMDFSLANHQQASLGSMELLMTFGLEIWEQQITQPSARRVQRM